MPSNEKHEYDIYSHKLHQTKDPKAKRKIEILAKRYDRIRKGMAKGNEEEAHIDLWNACLGGYFYVTGADLDGKSVDEALIDAIEECVRKYDSTKENATLVHYIAVVYPQRIKDVGEKQVKKDADETSLEALFEYGNGDASVSDSMGGSGAHWGRKGTPVFEPSVAGFDDPDVQADDEEEEDSYFRLITQILEFLNTRDAGRNGQDSALYRRMVFTERVTYHVKSQPTFSGCRAVEKYEYETFYKCMELGFLDSFMLEVVRTAQELYEGGMQNGYKKAIDRLAERMTEYERGAAPNPPKINWLPAPAYLSYLESAYGKKLTTGVPISQQRSQFDTMQYAVEDRIEDMRDDLWHIEEMVHWG